MNKEPTRKEGLEQLIQYHLGILKFLPENSKDYKMKTELLKQYALEYKEVTGDWYRGSW